MVKGRSARVMRFVRHRRVRQTVRGTSSRPRLALFRSLSHIYAQVIDDALGRTLVAASSLEPEVKENGEHKSKGELSRQVGALVARRAKEKGITQVAFDRGGYKYHGRVKALAEAALAQGVIDEGERRILKEWEDIRTDVIQVDAFEAEAYRSLKG